MVRRCQPGWRRSCLPPLSVARVSAASCRRATRAGGSGAPDGGVERLGKAPHLVQALPHDGRLGVGPCTASHKPQTASPQPQLSAAGRSDAATAAGASAMLARPRVRLPACCTGAAAQGRALTPPLNPPTHHPTHQHTTSAPTHRSPAPPQSPPPAPRCSSECRTSPPPPRLAPG